MRSAMRPFHLLACACLVLLAGCQAHATSPGAPQGQPAGSPACLPYRSSLAQGPVSIWGLRLEALQPVFPGEALTLVSSGPRTAPLNGEGGWSGAKRASFYIVADMKNVMWFGTSAGARACLSRHGVLFGRTDVTNGSFRFTARLPKSVTEGHDWYVVAVGDNGFYYVEYLANGKPGDQSMYRLAEPYTLTAWPGAAQSAPGGAKDVLEPGKPFQLRGKGIRPNGALLVRLDIRSPRFDSLATIGTIRVRGGELRATVELPKEPEIEGIGRRSLSPSWSYDLSLWSTNGKVVYYSLPVRLR